MGMVPFYTRFRELAFQEMRNATIQGWEDLPDGEYGFLELYCNDDQCDCRRVLIQVIAKVIRRNRGRLLTMDGKAKLFIIGD